MAEAASSSSPAAEESLELVPKYYFTDVQEREFISFVKQNRPLYDHGHHEFKNQKMKVVLWKILAARFESCTHLQCRKFYQKRRMEYDNIVSKGRSGTSSPPLTYRERLIQERWSFLEGNQQHTTENRLQRWHHLWLHPA